MLLRQADRRLDPNPRYVVTDLAGDAQALYDEVYCARGERENRIKEQRLIHQKRYYTISS